MKVFLYVVFKDLQLVSSCKPYMASMMPYIVDVDASHVYTFV